MKTFLITARTRLLSVTFRARARSSSEVAARACELFGDEPCGITVTLPREVPHGER
jgi:hypothetical protein